MQDELYTVQAAVLEKTKVKTGAGDHFNAGFCFGLLQNLPAVDSLRCGMSCARSYLQSGISPGISELQQEAEKSSFFKIA